MNNSRRNLMTAVPFAAFAGIAQATPAKGKGSRKKRVYDPDSKPASKEIPLYSPVISYGDMVFVSGHGVNTSTDIRKQTAEVLDYIERCLQTAGSSMANALKCHVFLRHLEDYAAMNEVFRGRFGPEPPVRTTVAVAGIPLEGCLVEIEVIAGI
jgi:enamine deaminase RidA (YjgF/YER057c/UK114 family)